MSRNDVSNLEPFDEGGRESLMNHRILVLWIVGPDAMLAGMVGCHDNDDGNDELVGRCMPHVMAHHHCPVSR
jgi:hypothetical protein